MDRWFLLGLSVAGFLFVLWIIRHGRKETPYALGGFVLLSILVPLHWKWGYVDLRDSHQLFSQMGAYFTPICIAVIGIFLLANFGHLRNRTK